MPKSSTEAEYLASMVPASAAATRVARRGFLKGALGAGALLSVPLLGACGGDNSSDTASSGGGGKPKGTVTFGSNEAGGDDPQKRRQALIAAYQKQSGLTVKANEVDHNTFQENINNYLQGKPDDVFAWFAGYRMRFFAQRGLIGDISDIYPVEGINDAFTKAATADDGKQYFVPPTIRGRSSIASRCGRSGVTSRRRRSTSSRHWPSRCRPTSSPLWRSPTRTAGRRWARLTSSTCASTATTSTSISWPARRRGTRRR
jgi:hypothetical protein